MKKHQNTKMILFFIISLILISFITYKEVLGYYFTDVDTFSLIWAGQIQSYKDVLRIFSNPLCGHLAFYRPISQLSYGIDHLIWGDNPFGYHLTDLLIHSMNTILVFWFAVVIFKNYKLRFLCAWMSAFLFSISAINIYVVPSITNRHDMIASFFLVVCLLAASKSNIGYSRRRLCYMVSLSSGVLSIFSKESAYVLPFLLGSYCFIFSDERDYTKRTKNALKYSIPLLAAVFCHFLISLHIIGHLPPIFKSLSTHIKSLGTFLVYLVDPIGLMKVGNFSNELILIIVLCCFVIVLLFYIIKNKGNILNLLLREYYKPFTFLLLYLALFGILYMLFGSVGRRYIYMPNIAFTLFIVGVAFLPLKTLSAVSFTKLLSLIIIIYIAYFSPLFMEYSAWSKSSEITQKIIAEIRNAVKSRLMGKDSPTIYLINLPLALEYKSGVKFETAGILRHYSMVAWAKMSASKEFPYVEMLTLSYVIISGSPSANPGVVYYFDDNKIYVKSKSGRIVNLSNRGQIGEQPIRYRSKDKEGEITFNRGLRENELLMLFDGEKIKYIDKEWIVRHQLVK